MDISRRKIEFIQDFLKLQNEEFIVRLGKLVRAEIKKERAQYKPMSEKELSRRIDKSMKDSQNESLISSNNLLNEIDEWN